MDAVVIGAGHAGLAVSQCLGALGVEHVVLERGRVAETWRSQRWDSFTLNTPTWVNRLPGDDDGHLGEPKDGFMTAAEVVDRLGGYATRWRLPIREGANVVAVERHDGGGFRVRTEGAHEPITTRSIVVASGIQNITKVPPIAAELPDDVAQVPALEYRSPTAIEPGAVLVVGGGQTGAQVAEDLIDAGRDVFWSLSRVTRVPRRYRGRDIIEWLGDGGFYDQPTASIDDPAQLTAAMPIVSGVGRYGHTVSIQWLAGKGVRLVGRITAVDGHVLELDDSVAACIRFGDERSAAVRGQVDGIIERLGRELPPEEPDEADVAASDPAAFSSPTRLDLAAEGVSTVVWATGVRGDYGYLPDGAVDANGVPVHTSGVSPIDGIFHIGLPWLIRRGSGIMYGSRADAEAISQAVVDRLEQRTSA